jgi:hypothetical protein
MKERLNKPSLHLQVILMLMIENLFQKSKETVEEDIFQ